MLHHYKLAREVSQLAHSFFNTTNKNYIFAVSAWENFLKDQRFHHHVQTKPEDVTGLANWQGDIKQIFNIEAAMSRYTVLAVDGSQIYPDRHVAGVNCFLLNIGGCCLIYDQKSSVQFFSEPTLFLPEQVMPVSSTVPFSADIVDLKREELEFEAAVAESLKLYSTHKNFICLFDGSLIFWHLESKPREIKEQFIGKYIQSLKDFYDHKIVMAGYLSMPRHKELVNLVKLRLCQNKQDNFTPCHGSNTSCPCVQFQETVDTDLLRKFLPKGHRTVIFRHYGTINKYYFKSIRPCFLYLNVGKEIVRIEIPWWIAQQEHLVALICSICLDQAEKGFGYPVALAEAHEQAVVKGPDRNLFFHLIRKVGIANSQQVFVSQKSIKKRGLGI